MVSEKDILTQSDIEEEVRLADLQEREIDFSGKILSSLILQRRTIKTGLNLKDAIILHSISLENTTITGKADLSGSVVKE